jgi:hypothetical protein
MNSSPLRLVVRAQSGKERRRRKEKKMATLVLWEVQSRLWRPIGTTTTKKKDHREEHAIHVMRITPSTGLTELPLLENDAACCGNQARNGGDK